MGESICVNISGPGFSQLLYENVCSDFDQEGFLLGEVITKEKRTITDNDHEAIIIEHTVKINSVVPCPEMGYFYNDAGRINKKTIKTYLDTQFGNVVACYKFKRTSSFRLTLREKLMIKQLATLFSPKAPDHFLWCLLTSQFGTDIGATHLFSQTFVRYNKPNFLPLPMHIVNLKDPHDIYKDAETSSTTFKNIVKSLNINVDKTQGYTIVSELEVALDKHISKVVKKLSDAEEELFALEENVEKLRLKLNAGQTDMDDLEDEFELLENGDTSIKLNDSITVTRVTRSKNKEPTPVKNYAQTLKKNKT